MQLNMNHCEAAHDLLKQSVIEQKIDVVAISEPCRKMYNGTYVTNRANMAAICVYGALNIQESPARNGKYYVVAKMNGIFIPSCYFPPSLVLRVFEEALDAMITEANGCKAVTIIGDFIVRATE